MPVNDLVVSRAATRKRNSVLSRQRVAVLSITTSSFGADITPVYARRVDASCSGLGLSRVPITPVYLQRAVVGSSHANECHAQ